MCAEWRNRERDVFWKKRALRFLLESAFKKPQNRKISAHRAFLFENEHEKKSQRDKEKKTGDHAE